MLLIVHLYHFMYTDAFDICLLKAAWFDLSVVVISLTNLYFVRDV